MTCTGLFVREIRFRPWTFLLAVIAVSSVAACLVGIQAFLSVHDAETETIVAELEQRSSERMASLRNDARVFSKTLGFNLLMLPVQQDPAEFYADNTSSHFFSAEEIAKLAATRFETVNHLLPILRHQVTWDRFGGKVVLMGVQGEIFIKAPSFQKPIEETIPPGQIHVGHAIAQRLALSPGDAVELLGESFTVRRMLPQKANIDDISILMNLADLQRMTGAEGKAGGILALSCNCAQGDLDPIRREVAAVIGELQVVEFSNRARARQQARDAIGKGTKAQIEDIKTSRGVLRTQAERLAALLLGVVMAGTIVLLGVMTLLSARERRTEIAMLRALGLVTRSILGLFLGKAFLIGLCGGVLGSAAGVLGARAIFHQGVPVSWAVLSVVVAVTTATAMFASAIPAFLAARTDPAEILNQA